MISTLLKKPPWILFSYGATQTHTKQAIETARSLLAPKLGLTERTGEEVMMKTVHGFQAMMAMAAGFMEEKTMTETTPTKAERPCCSTCGRPLPKSALQGQDDLIEKLRKLGRIVKQMKAMKVPVPAETAEKIAELEMKTGKTAEELTRSLSKEEREAKKAKEEAETRAKVEEAKKKMMQGKTSAVPPTKKASGSK